MLVLTRKVGEKIVISDEQGRIEPIVITLVDVDRNKARIGIEAERTLLVLREELTDDGKPLE